MNTVKRSEVSPAGGVILTNEVSYLHEDMYNGIDLDFEEYMKEKPIDTNDEDWGDLYYKEDSTYYIGFKKGDDGLLMIDYDAEYSAIIKFPYTQVVHSNFMSYAHHCSPCFPYQNDLQTAGDNETYTLPPDMFDDKLDEHLVIYEIEG